MRRLVPVIILFVIIFPFFPATLTNAMPEYATRVGEPCGTCHTSASGGGLRNPRGQAWVAQGKPNTVPAMNESLQILGVKMTADPSDYVSPTAAPAAAAPLATRYERKMMLRIMLLEFSGN
jgi:hypothetical protein